MIAGTNRLGPLGFLSTEDLVTPGNNGMKDQAQAIRWVHENIADFGGDPNRVTLFGESAGGVAVHYHMISPLSKGISFFRLQFVFARDSLILLFNFASRYVKD